MTDSLLQKIEDRVVMLLDELERLRKETRQLKQENTFLKAEHGNHTKKLQGLISLLDVLEVTDNRISFSDELESMQDKEDIAMC